MVVIGATGHIGSYLVPRLVRAGHQVVALSRGIAASSDRPREVLGYTPRYSALEALYEALGWLVANGQVDVGGQDFQTAAWG